jgi:hypothetical protein
MKAFTEIAKNSTIETIKERITTELSVFSSTK